jgi:hypothetical protein
MSCDELKTLQKLLSRFKLYRGYNKGWGRLGLSWTLDGKVAASIPLGFGRGAQPNPWVLTGWASSGDVIAFLNDRSEQEIIIDPRKVEILSDEPAPKPVAKRGGPEAEAHK